MQNEKYSRYSLPANQNHFLHLLEDYRVNHGSPHAIADAYKKICKDAESPNRMESDLAKFVLEKFSNFHLKVESDGHHHTAHSFLNDYSKGTIKDDRLIQQGMEGLCSNFGLTILRLCKTDAIEQLYRS